MIRHFPVPTAVLLAPAGLYPGDGGLDIDAWCTQYLQSGQHWVDWQFLCAQGQAHLAQELAVLTEALWYAEPQAPAGGEGEG
jgi:hypothetical protein